MTTYGLTPLGFVPKSYEICRLERVEKHKAVFGGGLDLSDNTADGKRISIEAEREAVEWELLEACVDSGDPDKVVGALQDALCALTGTWRDLAAPSTVSLTLTGDDAATVTVGEQVRNSVTSELFSTLATVVLSLATTRATTTAYILGNIVSNSSNIYLCVAAGTSDAGGGPTGTGQSISDGTVSWRFLGAGLAYAQVDAESDKDGPIVADAGELTEIVGGLAGWFGVSNILDAELGTVRESNGDLREKREREIATPGTTTVDAVRADLEKFVPDIISARGFWNHYNVVDGDGVPPHAVEFLVDGGTDQDIWDALLKYMGGGTQTFGSVQGVAVDSKGTSHNMAFSRLEEILIYVEVIVTYDSTYPQDGDDLIKDAIASIEKGNGYNATKTSISSACDSVQGVLEVISVFLGLAASPTLDTTLQIGTRQVAKYDTGRVVVASSEATP